MNLFQNSKVLNTKPKMKKSQLKTISTDQVEKLKLIFKTYKIELACARKLNPHNFPKNKTSRISKKFLDILCKEIINLPVPKNAKRKLLLALETKLTKIFCVYIRSRSAEYFLAFYNVLLPYIVSLGVIPLKENVKKLDENLNFLIEEIDNFTL